MTREFNKQQRYDSRPSFRHTPSNHYGDDERPARPARPRLNREIVDRAWENGANNRHPDYQPRQQGQASRNPNWKTHPYGAPSSPNGANNNHRSYGNRPNNYQKHSQPPFNDDRGTHRQSFDRPNDAPHRPYPGNGQRSNSNWQTHHNNGRYTPNDQQRFRSPNQPQGRGSGSNSSYSPYNRGRNEGEHRYGGPRDTHFERGYNGYANRQGPRFGNHPSHPQGPDRNGRSNNWRGRDPNYRAPYAERFEGDYERFGYEDHYQQQQRNKPYSAQGAHHEQPTPERHVTRLPDGRVLKGPRPAQRKNAIFWNEIAQDTASLLEQGHTSQALGEAVNDPAPEVVSPTSPPAKEAKKSPPATQVAPKKPTRRIASAERRKKAAGTKAAHMSGPRPSQRGFKWPTP